MMKKRKRLIRGMICMLCIVLLANGSVALSEKSDAEMLQFVYDGYYEDHDFAIDPGIAFTDYWIENAYGTFQITETYCAENVVRYLLVATPKVSSVRFVWDWKDAATDAEGLRSYNVLCVPEANAFMRYEYSVAYRYREEQLVCCYTLVGMEPGEVAGPLQLGLWILDQKNEAHAKDSIEIMLEDAGNGQTFSIDVDESMEGLYVESANLSISPLDRACVLHVRDINQTVETGILFLRGTGHDRGGSSPSEGYLYCVSNIPEGEMLPFVSFAIRGLDDVLVISREDGSKKRISLAAFVTEEPNLFDIDYWMDRVAYEK